MDIHYVPCLKTTSAELDGYRELSGSVKALTLPLFELTRSRTSRRNPDGDIGNNIDQLRDCVGDLPFILDLTTHPDLANHQIEALYDEADGFAAWRGFVSGLGMNVIPTIHVVEGDVEELRHEVRALEAECGRVAFRADAFDPSTGNYLREIVGALEDPDRLILIIDAGYLPREKVGEFSLEMETRIQEAIDAGAVANIVSLASSYPRSVVAKGFGGDEYGKFTADEVSLHSKIEETHPAIIYGDYGSIHPIRYPARGGGWVPKVDFPLDAHYPYHRYRRDVGGYVKCAEKVVKDEDYVSIGTWGDAQIELAVAGVPAGKSPSFWISVRVNIHITRQITRVLKAKGLEFLL